MYRFQPGIRRNHIPARGTSEIAKVHIPFVSIFHSIVLIQPGSETQATRLNMKGKIGIFISGSASALSMDLHQINEAAVIINMANLSKDEFLLDSIVQDDFWCPC